MKIWLDDIRTPPEGFFWCRLPEEVYHLLSNKRISFISFDHDLGKDMFGQDITGYQVACHIEKMAKNGTLGRLGWDVHSDNPNGRERISLAMISAERFWDINEDVY